MLHLLLVWSTLRIYINILQIHFATICIQLEIMYFFLSPKAQNTQCSFSWPVTFRFNFESLHVVNKKAVFYNKISCPTIMLHVSVSGLKWVSFFWSAVFSLSLVVISSYHTELQMDHQRKKAPQSWMQPFLSSLESRTLNKNNNFKCIFTISWKNIRLKHMLGGLHWKFLTSWMVSGRWRWKDFASPLSKSFK